MTIGIPKSFIYWKAPGYWEAFFETLGHKVILSPSSDKEIIETGAKLADQETCFANKIYWGHIKWLEGKCDMIFAPRLRTNPSGQEYCPKFFAIPDLAALVVKTPLLSVDFNAKIEQFLPTLARLGKILKNSKKEIVGAKFAADQKTQDLENARKKSFWEKMGNSKKKILLVSHPYNLYDEYSNLQIEKKLARLGLCAIFLDEAASLGASDKFVLKDVPELHWEFGSEMLKTVPSALSGHNFSGGIEISSFQCGCDAVIKSYVEDFFRERGLPFLYLMIDEQTGEAGYQTRLEAFADTLENKKINAK